MKKLSGILVFLFFTVSITHAQKKNKLEIEIGQGFQDDLVKIYLDDKLIYNKRVTTPLNKFPADEVYIRRPGEPVKLMVEVNGKKIEGIIPKFTKEMKKSEYSLLIQYDSDKEAAEIYERETLKNLFKPTW